MDGYIKTFGAYDPALIKNPISAIRVRVKNLDYATPTGREGLRQTAQLIQTRTGLDVDIMVGAVQSPREITLAAASSESIKNFEERALNNVDPARRGELTQLLAIAKSFNSQPLHLRELWSKKGVVVKTFTALDRKSLALFVLIMVSCLLTTVITTQALVRSRREELRLLSALGWRQGLIRKQLLGELTLVSASAGIVAALLTYPLASLLQISISQWRPLLTIPLAIAITLIAALLGSLRLEASNRRKSSPAKRLRIPTPIGIGLGRALRRPSRLALSALTVILASTSLTLLTWVQREFQGQLAGNLLGTMISIQIRTPDIIAIVILAILAAISIGANQWLTITEDKPVYATLHAQGWRPRQISIAHLMNAVVVATLGVTLGAGISVMTIGVISPPGLSELGIVALTNLILWGAVIVTAQIPAAIAQRDRGR